MPIAILALSGASTGASKLSNASKEGQFQTAEKIIKLTFVTRLEVVKEPLAMKRAKRAATQAAFWIRFAIRRAGGPTAQQCRCLRFALGCQSTFAFALCFL